MNPENGMEIMKNVLRIGYVALAVTALFFVAFEVTQSIWRKPCDVCGGSGRSGKISLKCGYCQGSGYEPKKTK